MRRAIFPIALALAALVVFAACKEDDEPGGTSVVQTAASPAPATQPATPAPAQTASPSSQILPLPPTPTVTPPATPPGVTRRISVDEARAAFERGEAVFVDVRGRDPYVQGHIPGALMIPFDEVERHAQKLPRNKLIITYCA